MEVVESSHLPCPGMEEEDYMKQQQMGCCKTLQSLKP
jgi:hypothetical protein